MKNITKLLAGLLAVVMIGSTAACGAPKTDDKTATTEQTAAADTTKTDDATKTDETKTDDAAPASGAVLRIYNSKGENATEFSEMARAYEAASGVTVKEFSIGSGQDHMEPLRAAMNTKEAPAIFSIQGLKELQEWQEGGFVVDFGSVDHAEFKALADAIPAGLRLTSDGANNFGIPYNVEGYGYIVDKQMLSDLFGADKADAVLAAIKTATYEEWEMFIHAIDTYIKTPSAAAVTLSGTAFTFVAEKTGLAANLNGVFAVMGAEKWTYGDHFVNVALNAAFVTPAEAHAADEAKLKSLEGLFEVYAKALDFKTSHLAGATGPAKRGPDFVSSANFGYDQAVQIFADSKAVFMKQGNWAFGNIEKVNPEMSARLTFVPVKMPFTDAVVTAKDRTVAMLNSTIPVFVPNYYAINSKVTAEEQKLAMDFLVWLNTTEEGQKFVKESFGFIPYNADPATTVLPNALGNSIVEYIKAGPTLSAPYMGAPASWSGDTLGLYMMENYMNKETWTPEDYKTISDYAISSWIELKG